MTTAELLGNDQALVPETRKRDFKVFDLATRSVHALMAHSPGVAPEQFLGARHLQLFERVAGARERLETRALAAQLADALVEFGKLRFELVALFVGARDLFA